MLMGMMIVVGFIVGFLVGCTGHGRDHPDSGSCLPFPG